jgi:malonyl-CoA O-methyltransferase
MHPALMLRGVQARFRDPETGFVTQPASRKHEICDYVMAALKAGFSIKRMSEYAVDEALAAKSERARRYLGWPMLLLFQLTP